ncbi:MAG: C45 family autoproteolytic acyltransferase/hydrolase [Synergistaceae bacterium]|nr:C45 family autoproteolytic acyltransferase/hydrolase [Synergistaceae bacterium]
MQEKSRTTHGIKYTIEKFPIVVLNGSWKEMGRAFGVLMRDELAQMIDFVTTDVTTEGEEIKCRTMMSTFSHRIRKYLEGLAEGAGLTASQVDKIAVSRKTILCGLSAPISSSVVTWNDYTSGKLILGSNFDYDNEVSSISPCLCLTVFCPNDSALSFASFGYAGMPYVTNAINEKGVHLGIANAMPSGGNLFIENRFFTPTALIQAMTECENLNDFRTFLWTTKASFSYLVTVADALSAGIFEWSSFDVKQRTTKTRPGLSVITNHFTEESWGMPRPDDQTYWLTRTRRRNLLNLAAHFKGAINEEVMKDILSTPIEQLGSMSSSTKYQTVVVPSEMKFLFNIPNYQDWTEINMADLFNKNRDKEA